MICGASLRGTDPARGRGARETPVKAGPDIGRAQHQDHIRRLRFLARGLPPDAHGKIADRKTTSAASAASHRAHTARFTCGILIVGNLIVIRWPSLKRSSSAANPLLKDVRRAIARGALTEQGWSVAETFHLLEEALRSDCEVKTVLAAESVRSAAEAHVRRLAGVKVVVLPDALLQSVSGTETSQGVMALVKPPEWKLEQLFRGCPLVVVLDGLQDPGNAGAIRARPKPSALPGCCFSKAR